MHAALPRVIPFAVFIGFLALNGILADLSPALGMDPRWWYGVRTVVVIALLVWFWRDYTELHSLTAKPVEWSMAIAIGLGVFALWINLGFQPLMLGTASGFDPRQDGRIDWAVAATRAAGAALVVPVMEELFWRSFLMRWIRNPAFRDVVPAQAGLRGLAISSAVFAVEHDLWFAGLLAGLAYGWLYMRSGNLWVPIAAHAVTNASLAVWVLYTGRWEFW